MTIDTGIIAVSSLHYPFYKLVIMLKSAYYTGLYRL